LFNGVYQGIINISPWKKTKNKRAKNSSHHQRRKKYKAKKLKPGGSLTTGHCNWHDRSNNKSKEITKII